MKIDNFFCNQNCVPETPDDASKRNEESYWNIPIWKIIHYGCCFKNVSQPKFYKSQAILNHTFKLTKQSEANFFMIGWMILSIKITLWLNIEMFERRNNLKQVFFFYHGTRFFRRKLQRVQNRLNFVVFGLSHLRLSLALYCEATLYKHAEQLCFWALITGC